MKLRPSSAILLTILITGMYACKTTKTTTGTTPVITSSLTYTKDVKPIIDEHCGNSCHAADHPAAGIDLTRYETVKYESVNGKLVPSIQHEEGVIAMPKKHPKLDDPTIAIIVEWAQGGASE